MSLSAERLYGLLPAVYRLRDAEQGEPLKALTALFARELEALEENLAQLYDDQFIETCADWVAPYIGDLIGYRPIHGVAPAVSSPRAEVANTIAYRRRKGTALMLEQLARDVTGWPAHAVEFFEQLATTQYMNHLRPRALATTHLRDTEAMLLRGGAFNRVAHTAEMRRPETGSGRYNIPNIGLFLWRLQAHRLSQVLLTPDAGDATGRTTDRRWRLNPLGADQPLFRWPLTEQRISQLAGPPNVPAPISLRLMALAVRANRAAPGAAQVFDDYGPDSSVVLLRPGATPSDPPVPVPLAEITVCDLRDVTDSGGTVIGWAHEAALPAGQIGLDPERGRVLLGSGVSGPLLATYHHGFSRPIGGGEYERVPSGDALVTRLASQSEALQPHLDAVAGGQRLLITDSRVYAGTPVFKVAVAASPSDPGVEVVVSAGVAARPVLAAGGDVLLDIAPRGRLVIEGLVVSGGALVLPAASDNDARELVLRDCTLLPGRTLAPDGTPVRPGAPSLVVQHPFAKVTLERCITGPLWVVADATLTASDCIVDACAPTLPAYQADAGGTAGGEASFIDCTVVGKVRARSLVLASNTIFFAALATSDPWRSPVWVTRKQAGCVRFCWLPEGGRVPRRFHCLPDATHPRVKPAFTSLRYADPGYAQLRASTDAAIRSGADDEGEIGVMHPLHQPQREANLRVRLDEYLRFGLHAGLFYAT